MKKTIWLLALLPSMGPVALRAANPGDEAVVLYNSRLPESKDVAQHYAERRHVPASQVFGLPLSTNEEISRFEFRDSLEKPLAKQLEEKHLWSIRSRMFPASSNQPAHIEWHVNQTKIRYLVLCYGIPLRIAEEPNLKEDGLDKVRPELRRNVAAVDSELAMLPLIEQGYPLHGPFNNWTYGATNTVLLNPTNSLLMVARLDGPSAAVARGLVDKALQAETDGLWGRAYFDLRNTPEPGLKIGDDWIRGASEISRHLGFETVVDENPGTFPASFPMSQIALYVGWYSQDADGPFTKPNVEFMPGAFAYHLFSFSAVTLRSTTRGWAGPLLARGAAATMGCVDEPYIGGTPDMAAFTSRFIFHAFTFGEAAYACQPVLSWQTTVVGDPLYRPFGGNPEKLHERLVENHSKLAEWSFLRMINLAVANGRPISEAVAGLEQLDLAKTSAVLSEKLGDLYAAQGKPSSAAHEYQLALKLGPTPEQKIRLLLNIGDKLQALGREADAYDNYQTLLRDFPAYPDKVAILKTLVPLARKLDKKSDLESYEAQLRSLSTASK
jgi:uncharacterized protein (TIGR03790 family)